LPSLQRHVRSAHAIGAVARGYHQDETCDSYNCVGCEKTFNTKWSLKRHVRSAHANDAHE